MNSEKYGIPISQDPEDLVAQVAAEHRGSCEHCKDAPAHMISEHCILAVSDEVAKRMRAKFPEPPKKT